MHTHSATPTLVDGESMKSLSTGPSTPSSSTGSKHDAEKGEQPHYAGHGTESEPYIVKFGENDPENPLNCPDSRKWGIVVNVGMTTLCAYLPSISREPLAFPSVYADILLAPALEGVAFGSSVYAGGFAPMLEYFEASSLVLTLGLSLYVRSLCSLASDCFAS